MSVDIKWPAHKICNAASRGRSSSLLHTYMNDMALEATCKRLELSKRIPSKPSVAQAHLITAPFSETFAVMVYSCEEKDFICTGLWLPLPNLMLCNL
jgi:hypothetical protein